MYCVRRSASSAASSSSLSLLMAVSRDWISQSRVLTVCSQVCTSFEYSKRWRLCLASSFSFSSSETLAPCEKCFMSVTVDRSRSSSLRIWMIKSFRPRRSWLMVSANTLLTLSASDTRSSLIARLDLSLRTVASLLRSAALSRPRAPLPPDSSARLWRCTSSSFTWSSASFCFASTSCDCKCCSCTASWYQKTLLSSVLTLASSASSAFLLRRTLPIVLSPEIEPASDESGRPRRGAVLDSLALEGADCKRSAACFSTRTLERRLTRSTISVFHSGTRCSPCSSPITVCR
mmetsp:Transcript_41727/g.100390  ORF Transcript_41727/g.100390 Transcript_41727/m.100390 type:complete len:290 (+) Transcript_41727:646-1515(+)